MLRLINRHELADRFFRPGSTGAELGVYCGDFAAELLKRQPQRLYLVDRWRETGMPIEGPEALETVLARFRDERRVRICQRDTVAWLREQPAASLDWVYLDSTHSRPHVYRELCQALRVVKAGGVVAGHDFGPATPGVVCAVQEFCEEHGQQLAAVTDETEHQTDGAAWKSKRLAFNSFAIVISK